MVSRVYGKYMSACLNDAFWVGAVTAVVREAWKAVRMVKVILTYGSVACDGAGDAGHLVHVVVGHVKEKNLRLFVADVGDEGLLFSTDFHPTATLVFGKHTTVVPVVVRELDTAINEVLPECDLMCIFVDDECTDHAVGFFIEGDTGVRRAVG
jgi:hypothetical protein